MKKFLLVAAVVAALGFGATPARATVQLLFDPDGTGAEAAVQAQVFDIAPGNALAVGVVPAGSPAPSIGDTFDLYFQGRMSSLRDVNNNATFAYGLGNNKELTVVAAFTEVVTNVSGPDANGNVTVTFALAPVQTAGLGYLRFFYDAPADASDLNGTGFFDGTLVLDATVTRNSGSFTGDVDAADAVQFDQVGANNYPGQLSTVGAGGTEIEADVVYANPDFFITPPPDLLRLVLINTSQKTPFQEVNPSMVFNNGAIVPSLGAINGINGPDFQFQADANASFTAVPAPSALVLALLGFGTTGAAGAFRRWTRRQA